MLRTFVPLLRLCLCLAVVSAAAQSVQQLPKIEGESFAGRRVVFPDVTGGKIAVLVLGFTKASKAPTSEWARKLSADFGSRPGFELYQLPVLEDVPRLFRGMVISGIKKGIPENARDHFVPILQGEAELKKAVNYQEADDAYLILLDRTGKLVHQIHGPFTDASYSTLRTEIQSLLDQK